MRTQSGDPVAIQMHCAHKRDARALRLVSARTQGLCGTEAAASVSSRVDISRSHSIIAVGLRVRPDLAIEAWLCSRGDSIT